MSDKKKKKQKLKARLPRGFVDRSPADIRATEEMMAKIKGVYEKYGFDPVETPMFEYTEALGKFLPDSDRPNEGVFSLTDDDDQWMSLRYDLTAPLARHVAENINTIQLPYRTYRAGWVFRNEKPGPGRFRQFMQFDADSVGAPGVQADAEMCMMMADTMEALGIARGDYVIRVNNRKVLDGVMEAHGITDGQKLTVLRSLDKHDKFGSAGVYELLTDGRKDESGDFTPGAGVEPHTAKTLLLLFEEPEVLSANNEPLKVKIGDEVISFGQTWLQYLSAFTSSGQPIFADGVTKSSSAYWTLPISIVLSEAEGDATTGFEGVGELLAIYEFIRSCGYDEDRIKIDPSVVRGLEYYTGPVYEAELLFDVVNEKGETVQFGSVGGGGRYDGLVKRFTGQDVPATGFSIGVSRLMTALKNLGKLGQDDIAAPVLVTVMDGDTAAIGRYQKLTQDLRAAGIRAEMYQGNWKKFGNQLKYADRRGCPIAIIQGSDEREKGVLQIKDMIEGRRQAAAIESNEEWREERPGQFEIAETDLVSEVKRVLKEQVGE